MTCNTKNPSRAFTLLETMVAIAILLTAIVGPMSIMGDAITQMYTARDQMLAISLVQEGLEVVRQKRDSNMLARWEELGVNPDEIPRAHWYEGLSADEYRVEFASDGRVTLAPGSSLIYKNKTSGLYTQSEVNGDPTKFTRAIIIKDTEGPSDEKEVTSTVTWRTGQTDHSLTVKEYIFGINEP